MEERIYTIEVKSDKDKATFVRDLILKHKSNAFEVPAVPKTAVEDFIAGKRKNIWEVTINEITMLTVEGDEVAAKTLLNMINTAKVEELEFAPIPVEYFEAFIAGNRDNVLQLDMKIVQGEKKEELPGHV